MLAKFYTHYDNGEVSMKAMPYTAISSIETCKTATSSENMLVIELINKDSFCARVKSSANLARLLFRSMECAESITIDIKVTDDGNSWSKREE